MLNPNIVAGATYLDRVKPGWEKEIDLEKLDIGNCNTCVLGQLFDHYIVYIDDNDLSVAWAGEHGFSAYPRPNTGTELTDQWKEFI